MNKADDPIRSFGMSGFIITEELRKIEQRFGIDLGHVAKSVAENPTEYYPQFEKSVRIEAAEMATHYELFYCLEQSIRKLISETLQESKGADWWDSGKVPESIVKEVKERVQKEVDSGMTTRSDDAIDYTTFGELASIITSNWDLFGTIFKSPRAVQRVMSNLNTLRGPIAHCCPITEDEIVRLRLTVKDWFRMIG